MAKFLALTSRGLIDVLEQELQELGFPTEKSPDGVYFESDWKGCYKANLWLRTATRVLFPLAQFEAQNPDELYNGIKAIDFTEWLDPEGTLVLDGSARESRFRDQRFVALKSKDAIVDQFREKYDKRPNVDKDNPDLMITVRVVKQTVSVAIDTSGESLNRRGYRKRSVKAPVKEHLAAGLLLMSGWDKKSPVVDPMCGSGTFLIEAALIAMNTAPGLNRKSFAFQRLKNFDQAAWDEVVSEALDAEKMDLDFKFYGSDKDKRAIEASGRNVSEAGLTDFIELDQLRVEEVDRPEQTGLFIVNPPYGERLGEVAELNDDYKDLGYTLKNRFQGWTAWILSGDPKLTVNLGMKATRKFPVLNGAIECRFLKYEVREVGRP